MDEKTLDLHLWIYHQHHWSPDAAPTLTDKENWHKHYHENYPADVVGHEHTERGLVTTSVTSSTSHMTPNEFMKKYPHIVLFTMAIDTAGGISFNPCEMVNGILQTADVPDYMAEDLNLVYDFMNEVLNTQTVEINRHNIDAKVLPANHSDN